MNIRQLLRLKTTSKHVCQVYNKSRLNVIKIDKPLYGDYFKTDLGIFKFSFDGWFGNSPVWHTIVILPLTNNMEGNVD